MDLDSDWLSNLAMLGMVILLFITYYPVANWLRVRQIKEDAKEWNEWVKRKESREQYIKKHPSPDRNRPSCYFCASNKLRPELQKQTALEASFGVLNNRVHDEVCFYSYYCAVCGNELFRECRGANQARQ